MKDLFCSDFLCLSDYIPWKMYLPLEDLLGDCVVIELYSALICAHRLLVS